jgi:hypothetical protein
MRLLMDGRADFRIENDLDQTLPVSQINKDDAAVIPASLHPAHQDNSLAGIGRP